MVDISQLQQAPPTGLIGSEQAMKQGLTAALGGLQEGIGVGRADLEPFAGAGRGAIGLQSALSGAGGQQAQQDAFGNFISSPGQQFLRDRAEKSLIRNQAAIGGLGGGNVRSALQEQAIGFAAQDFGNQFNRLGQVAGQGLTAAGGQAGFAAQGGRDAANFGFNTGQSLAGGRTQAGRDIAQSIGGTTSALADLINQQGTGLGNILGGATGNLANLLSGAGAAQGQSQTQLATLLANIATQQGTQAGQITRIPGIDQQPGTLGGLGTLLGGIGAAGAGFGFG